MFYMCMHVWASIILNFKPQPCEGPWETNSIRYFRAPFYPLEVSECKVASYKTLIYCDLSGAKSMGILFRNFSNVYLFEKFIEKNGRFLQ